MARGSESAYRHHHEEYATAYELEPRRRGRAQVQLILAILGLVSLGYMLWTIAQLLGVI